jgi:hypothetical protein
MNSILYILIFLIVSFQSLSVLALNKKDSKIVTTAVLPCYLGPVTGFKMPAFMESAVVQMPHLNQERPDYRLCDQFLFNEVVNCGAEYNNSGYCDAKQGPVDQAFGGLVEQAKLKPADDWHLSQLNYVVAVPLLELDSGFEKIIFSMGTKLQVAGEMNDLLGVSLPEGRGAFVPKSSWSKWNHLRKPLIRR